MNKYDILWNYLMDKGRAGKFRIRNKLGEERGGIGQKRGLNERGGCYKKEKNEKKMKIAWIYFFLPQVRVLLSLDFISGEIMLWLLKFDLEV